MADAVVVVGDGMGDTGNPEPVPQASTSEGQGGAMGTGGG